ncbi:hypothetical protein, partial [Pseudomonas sp. 3A(2025)]
MTWSLKAIIHPPRDRKFAILFSFGAPGIVLAGILWSLDLATIESYDFPIFITVALLLTSFAILAGVRQKTLFNYRVYPDHVESDECLYYPEYTEDLFKGIVIV